jgi:hypothetical protein
MRNREFDWQRYWINADDNSSAFGDEFLPDPDSEYAHLRKSTAVTYDKIAHYSCLFLLGEAGIGKTSTIKHIVEKLRRQGEAVIFQDLAEISETRQLEKYVFEHDDFEEWTNGSHDLHLFLDSLDECILAFDTVVSTLVKGLKQIAPNLGRLKLRIACRTGYWEYDRAIADNFETLFRDSDFGIFELAPIREKDAREAAKHLGLDSDTFLAEVRAQRLVPLARVPVTFRLIIDIFKNDGQLPTSRAEIYRRGCEELCREETARLQQRLELSGRQRLLIAERVAALSLFAGRSAILLEASQSDQRDADLTIADVVMGTEDEDGYEVAVNEQAVVETLKDTGLFVGKGEGRMTWAHRSFEEFLAARYLARRGATVPQIMNLIIHPGGSESRITPQLRGVASWLLTLKPALFERLVAINPDALLESDLHVLGEGQREELVDQLLNQYRVGALTLDFLPSPSRYLQLRHPKLSEQLRLVLSDSEESWQVQSIALDIVQACEVESVCLELKAMALSDAWGEYLRARAIQVIASNCEDEHLLQLKPLALQADGRKTKTRILSQALSALWPNHLRITDVLEAARTIGEGAGNLYPNLTGQFPFSRDDKFFASLTEEDFVEALAWRRCQDARSDFGRFCSEVNDRIVLHAWQRGGHRVFRHLSKTFLALAARKERFFETHSVEQDFWEEVDRDANKRRAFIKNTVQSLDAVNEDVIQRLGFEVYSHAYDTDGDLSWSLDRFKYARLSRSRWNWAYLLRNLFPARSTEVQSKVIEEYNASKELSDVLAPYLQTVDLQSQKATELREQHLESQKFRETRKQSKQPLCPPPSKRIAENLGQIESGKEETWINLYLNTTLLPTSRFPDPRKVVITDNSGWKNADQDNQVRIVEAARLYLKQHEPDVSPEWVVSGNYPNAMLAGYAAIRLLYDHDSSFIESLTSDEWSRWVSAVINSPTSSTPKNAEIEREILRTANKEIPSEIAQIWRLLISDKETSVPFYVLDACWSERLAQEIKQLVKNKSLPPFTVGKLLEKMFQNGDPEAQKIAESLIPSKQPTRKRDWRISLEAAFQFLWNEPLEAWPVVWTLIRRRKKWGNELIRKLAYHRTNPIAPDLKERQLSEFYLFLSRRFPKSEDPEVKLGRAHNVTPRHSIADFRDGLIRELINYGTWEAVTELMRIQSELGQCDFSFQINRAKEEARRSTWRPVSPCEILDLLAKDESRLVRDSNQLLKVIMESIERLQDHLFGKVPAKTPATADLWNEVKRNQALNIGVSDLEADGKDEQARKVRKAKGTGANQFYYIPKDEERLSDYVQRHLSRDIQEKGVIVNREVQVKRGQETDLYIDAVNPETEERAAVVIEIKGCWNRDLDESIETQLANRYIDNSHARHGLYLVGWFLCDQWHPSDYRKASTPRMSVEEAQKHFRIKAEALTDGRIMVASFVLDATWQEE